MVIPLYREFVIYKNGQIIEIISNININGFYFRIYNHDPCLHIPEHCWPNMMDFPSKLPI
jgi:hypothetical protein